MCKGREVSAGSISYTLFRLTIVAVLVGWTVGHVASEMIGRFKNDTTAVSMITFYGLLSDVLCIGNPHPRRYWPAVQRNIGNRCMRFEHCWNR